MNLRDRTATGPPDPAVLSTGQRQRRERIVRAAMNLLQQSDYDSIQMRDVAASAGVALGTVYRYFSSKEHLFAVVLQEWAEALDIRVQRRPLRGGTVEAQLHDLMTRVVDAFERKPQFFALLSMLDTAPDPNARAAHQEFTRRTRQSFTGPLARLSDADAAAVVDVLNAVLGGSLRGWMVGSVSLDEARRRIDRCISLIFSAPPGEA